MRTLTIFTAFVLFGIQIQSASGKPKTNFPNVQQTETRAVSNFTGISSGGHFNVFVKLGSTESLEIEAEAETLKYIETVVENSVLKIRVKNRLNRPMADLGKVTITITAKSLNALSLSGSGSMSVDGIIKSKNLNTSVSGSGSLDFDADVSDLKAIISGSGSMSAGGKGTHAVVTVSGSGSFNSPDLKVNTAEIRVSGSGGATIHAQDHLSAILIGAGNIRYKGDPHVDIITKTGSGTISKI
ncbi:MAG TPA: head GIN domain-containing protein [Sphingobacteriaceae bacterium]